MPKIQNILEIPPTLGFTEFDIIEKYRQSFHESELSKLYSIFPFERMAKTMGLSEQDWDAGTSSVLRRRSPLWS